MREDENLQLQHLADGARKAFAADAAVVVIVQNNAEEKRDEHKCGIAIKPGETQIGAAIFGLVQAAEGALKSTTGGSLTLHIHNNRTGESRPVEIAMIDHRFITG